MNRTRHLAVMEGLLFDLVLTTIVWLSLALVDASDRMAALLAPKHARSRSAAQTLVEWSLAAAVLALVGIGAWQLAGTAISDAINRTIGSLNRAGA